MTEFKWSSAVVDLVQQEQILLCGVRGCTAAIWLTQCPAPASLGWVLAKGWWLCPEHREVDNDD